MTQGRGRTTSSPPIGLADMGTRRNVSPATARPGADQRNLGRWLLLLGALVFSVAAVITLITYLNATRHGGTYLVLWGPMAMGLALLGAGVVQRSRARTAGRASWKPDPTWRHQQSYWDGSAWNADVADDGAVAVDQGGAADGAETPLSSMDPPVPGARPSQ